MTKLVFLFLVFISFHAVGQSDILVLDARFRDAVYDYNVFQEGGSNATEIENILDRLDYEVNVEHTSISWMTPFNIQRIANINPDLIIIHTSAFFNPINPGDIGIYDRLIGFLQSVNASGFSGKVLVYSRLYFVQGGRNGLQTIIHNTVGLQNRLRLIEITSFLPSSNRSYFRSTVSSFLD